MLLIYLKTIGVLALAAAGAVVGLRAGRWKKPWWLVAYVVPLTLILAIVLARRFPRLEFLAPTAWLMAGRTEFIAFGVAVPVLFGTVVPKLRHKRERLLLWLLVCMYVIAQSALPFLLPAFTRGTLAAIEMTIDRDGVCLQSTGYTCGAASAVTALRQLGIEANEGELAILSHTSRMGTAPDLLCAAINRRFAGQGVRAECRWFGSIGDLRGKEPVMAAVRYRFLIDHFVTVLRVTDSEVVIGDPLVGRESLSYDEFANRWRRYGIMLTRSGLGVSRRNGPVRARRAVVPARGRLDQYRLPRLRPRLHRQRLSGPAQPAPRRAGAGGSIAGGQRMKTMISSRCAIFDVVGGGEGCYAILYLEADERDQQFRPRGGGEGPADLGSQRRGV